MPRSIDPADADTRLLSARIADEIRDAVLAGDMEPGTRVGQEALAAKFGASRIPVREALRQLESEGLVVLAPNRGAWIADVGSAESLEIYKIREVVEPLAISESVARMTEADVEEIAALVRELERTVTLEEYIRLDRIFHLKTYSRAGMPQLLGMVERFWNSTQHFRRRLVKDSLARDGFPFSDPHHLLLLEMIRDRDGQGAASIVHLHVRRTRLQIQQMIKPAAGADADRPARVRRPRSSRAA
ncbi:MAG: GntR family transcriptional regulator [Burkholderiaceae bacterium]